LQIQFAVFANGKSFNFLGSGGICFFAKVSYEPERGLNGRWIELLFNSISQPTHPLKATKVRHDSQNLLTLLPKSLVEWMFVPAAFHKPF